MRRCAEPGGLFYDIERDFARLSAQPLDGRVVMQTLDERMEQLGSFYLRPVLTASY